MIYSELVNYIKQYTENEETTFVANIPLFVKLAEEDIYRNVNFPVQSKVATATATSASNAVALASDFLAFDYCAIVAGNTYSMLLNKETSFIYQAYPDVSVKSQPLYYALRDETTIILGPWPDTTYTLSYQYMYKPASIVSASTTWVGTNAENALLYGSLVNAYTYMKGEDSLMQTYKGLYQEALGMAKQLGEGYERSDAYRDAPAQVLPPGTGQS